MAEEKVKKGEGRRQAALVQRRRPAKKSSQYADEAPAMNFTSMIDVVFLLLIFFMCATKFKSIDRRLDSYLPKDKGPFVNVPVRVIQPDPLRILVIDDVTRRASGNIRERSTRTATFVFNDPVQGERFEGTEAAERLYQALLRFANIPEQTVVIVPADEHNRKDQQVPFQEIMKVLDACARAKIKKVELQMPIRPRT